MREIPRERDKVYEFIDELKNVALLRRISCLFPATPHDVIQGSSL